MERNTKNNCTPQPMISACNSKQPQIHYVQSPNQNAIDEVQQF